MKPSRHTKNNQILLATEVLFVLTGICIFACLVHREGILFLAGIAGLVFAAIVLARAVFLSGSPAELLGLARFDRTTLVFSSAGIVVGLIAAWGYRTYYGLSLLPGTLTVIALISPLVGMTEELVFRGYLQGRSQAAGPVAAVFIAAFGHTLYKFLVLKSMTVSIAVDFPRLVLFTFIFGLVVGIFRQLSRSVFPALAAHALFDILIYGDFSEMPVWVWG
jgi:membrane protease YdiL (CAAX protease family)